MPIKPNGATIRLNKHPKRTAEPGTAVVRDKNGAFVGMKHIDDLIAELRLLRDNSEGVVYLFEIENFSITPKTEQRDLDMSVRF